MRKLSIYTKGWGSLGTYLYINYEMLNELFFNMIYALLLRDLIFQTKATDFVQLKIELKTQYVSDFHLSMVCYLF